MLFGMIVALIATAIIDRSDGEMDTDAKYYIANTLMGGLIGGWVPNYARDVLALKRLDRSWHDSIKYAL